MKKKNYLILVLIFCINFSFAQIGIGTTSPDAQLDIRSINPASPAINDGVLIPKVDNLTAIPTIAQQGMLVYLTTNISATYQKGFYYWDFPTLTWIGISSTANGDKDWYEVGTTIAPDAITDDMFHTGNVALGKNTAVYPLEINGLDFNRTLNVTTTNNVTDGTANSSILNDYTGNSDDAVNVSRNTFSGTSLGNVIGNSVQLNSSGNNPFFGSYNVISNSSSGAHIAIQNSLGFSTNNNTGVRNLMQNITTNGSFTGISNELYNNTGNGLTTGVYNLLGTSGTSAIVGESTSIFGSGGGTLYGNYFTISNTGNGTHYGIQNNLSGSGTGVHYANYNIINGSGTGNQFGNYTSISNTGGANHWGSAIFLNSLSLTGTRVGYSVDVTNNGTGVSTGFSSLLGGTGTSTQTGQFNSFTNTGNGIHYGVQNSLSGTGSGDHFAIQNTLNGTGTGIKYGTYNLINTSAGGTHYGVYSNVLKPGTTNFAGYFLGNVGIGTLAANTYTFPPSRGTVGQTMRTDGAGNVTWANNSDFAWSTVGNTGTVAGTNFIGTTDGIDFRIKTGNFDRWNISNANAGQLQPYSLGTALLPIYSFQTDTNTGIFSSAADFLNFSTAGTQRMIIGNTGNVGINIAPSTYKLDVNSAAGDAIFGHSTNVGGVLGYETNFTVGSAGTIQGAGVYASNPTAGYTSLYSQSTGAATVAANINFSNVWIANYNLVDNASATFNPSASYSQLNVTNSALAGLFQNAIYGYNNRGTTASNPAYTVGVNGLANSQNQDALGVVGRSFSNTSLSVGGYFEGNTYAGGLLGYAYVGGNVGSSTKITGLGAVAEIIPTEKHGRITVICPESPEYWYQDYGIVEMINGKATIILDEILADIIVVDDDNPIRVICTPVGMPYFNGITIMSQTKNSVEILELNGGNHSGKLQYQIVTKPKTNYGEGRFHQAPGPAYLKAEKEPLAAKAKNQNNDGRKIFRWPSDAEVYKYNPEDLVGIGDVIPGGPNAGKIKLGNGKYKVGVPMENSQAKR